MYLCLNLFVVLTLFSASNGAKRCLANGGFRATVAENFSIGQVQLLDVPNLENAKLAIEERADDICDLCKCIHRCSMSL